MMDFGELETDDDDLGEEVHDLTTTNDIGAGGVGDLANDVFRGLDVDAPACARPKS